MVITYVTYKSEQTTHAPAGQYISVCGVSLSDDGAYLVEDITDEEQSSIFAGVILTKTLIGWG